MNCPHCHEPIDPAAIPDATLRAERARRNQAKRVTPTPGTGRPPKPTACPRCGQLQPSASAARRHKCGTTSAASAARKEEK